MFHFFIEFRMEQWHGYYGEYVVLFPDSNNSVSQWFGDNEIHIKHLVLHGVILSPAASFYIHG